MRWRLTPLTGSPVDITGTPNWTFGFCHGTTDIPGTKNVQNFVGIKPFLLRLPLELSPILFFLPRGY
jgi:hypothetical protein